MKIAVFSAKPNDRQFIEAANVAYGHELIFFGLRLTRETSELVSQFPAICVFVYDHLDYLLLTRLTQRGIRVIMLRPTEFNNIDLVASLLAKL